MHSRGLRVRSRRKKNKNVLTVKVDRKIHNEDTPNGQNDCTQNTEVKFYIHPQNNSA